MDPRLRSYETRGGGQYIVDGTAAYRLSQCCVGPGMTWSEDNGTL